MICSMPNTFQWNNATFLILIQMNLLWISRLGSEFGWFTCEFMVEGAAFNHLPELALLAFRGTGGNSEVSFG